MYPWTSTEYKNWIHILIAFILKLNFKIYSFKIIVDFYVVKLKYSKTIEKVHANNGIFFLNGKNVVPNNIYKMHVRKEYNTCTPAKEKTRV